MDSEMRDNVDVRLTAAFHDVPAPEGLADRLLARLAAERPTAQCVLALSTKEIALGRRRRLFAHGGLLAVAVALLMAVWIGSREESLLSQQFVLDEAIRSFDVGIQGRGRLVSEEPAPEAYPMSRTVVRVRGTRWRRVDDFLGGGGVVYQLPGPSETKALLYVIDRKAEGLESSPSLYPFMTAGKAASAWQEGNLLYVLVVQGDRSTYKGYLNLHRGTLVLTIGRTYLNPCATAGRRLSQRLVCQWLCQC